MMTNVCTGIVQEILWISKCNKSSKVLGTYAKLSGCHPGLRARAPKAGRLGLAAFANLKIGSSSAHQGTPAYFGRLS